MFPEPLIKGGLQAWIKSQPLGAAWDTEERRAEVLSYDPDGKNEKIVATGLRNCAGLTIQPATGLPWCVVNERDELGDNTPFEYATSVKDSAFYGWPWYYLGSNEDPRHKNARPDLKGKAVVPDVLMQAHTAPLQIVFYQGDNFPASYKGSAFVTMHGSWNRAQRAGYKVVRLSFAGTGKPTGIRGLHDRLRPLRQAGLGPAGRRRCRPGRFTVRDRRRQRHDLARQPPAHGVHQLTRTGCAQVRCRRSPAPPTGGSTRVL